MNTNILQVVVGVLAVVGLAAVIAVYTLDDTGLNNPLTQTSERIAVNHYYDAGIHTLAGSVVVPTPCHRLYARADNGDEDPAAVKLSLRTEQVADPCDEEANELTFFLSFHGTPDINPVAELDGKPVAVEVNPVDSTDALLKR